MATKTLEAKLFKLVLFQCLLGSFIHKNIFLTQRLARELKGYNQTLNTHLVDGFLFGFRLGCVGEQILYYI